MSTHLEVLDAQGPYGLQRLALADLPVLPRA